LLERAVEMRVAGEFVRHFLSKGLGEERFHPLDRSTKTLNISFFAISLVRSEHRGLKDLT